MRHVWLQMRVWRQFQGSRVRSQPGPIFSWRNFEKVSRRKQKYDKLPSMQRVNPFSAKLIRVNPFSANCFVLNAFNVCCRYSSVIQTSLLSWSWKQSLWTRISLILREQSYLGLLQYLIPKSIFRQNGQSKSVWLVGKGVNLCISHVQQIHWKVLSWAL